MWKRVLLLMLGLCIAVDAYALDPFMWGIGPRIGTMVIPGRYPLKFHRTVTDESDMEKVRHDMMIGAQGAYYAGSFTRLVLDAGLGFGKGYFDGHVMLKYNYVAQAGAMDFLFGGGTGFGSMTFKSEDGHKLNIPYYPLRGEGAVLIRDNTRGYQLTIYYIWNIPGNHYFYDADEEEVDTGPGVYMTLGIELSVLFGDFTPPRPRRD